MSFLQKKLLQTIAEAKIFEPQVAALYHDTGFLYAYRIHLKTMQVIQRFLSSFFLFSL